MKAFTRSRSHANASSRAGCPVCWPAIQRVYHDLTAALLIQSYSTTNCGPDRCPIINDGLAYCLAHTAAVAGQQDTHFSLQQVPVDRDPGTACRRRQVEPHVACARRLGDWLLWIVQRQAIQELPPELLPCVEQVLPAWVALGLCRLLRAVTQRQPGRQLDNGPGHYQGTGEHARATRRLPSGIT